MPKNVTSLRQTHPWLALKKGAKGEGRRCKYAWEDVTLSSGIAATSSSHSTLSQTSSYLSL